MKKKAPWHARLLCKLLGHKFTTLDLIVFEIKNSPINVEKHGYSSITCPRCKQEFNPGE